MFTLLLSIVLLSGHGLSQETGAATAQNICDSLGSVGRYPNPADITCKQYAKCFPRNNALIGAFYNCTGSTFFNPNSQYCSTTYQCSAATTTTAEATTATTELEETTSPETTSTSSAPTSAQNICDSQSAVGRYPNPDDSSCHQYALCFNSNGTLAGSFYNCTGASLFDPNLQSCRGEYVCGEGE